MHLNNDYISRYRSVPAASYTAELSDRMIPYLPYCDGHEGLFLSTPMHYHPEAEIILEPKVTPIIGRNESGKSNILLNSIETVSGKNHV